MKTKKGVVTFFYVGSVFGLIYTSKDLCHSLIMRIDLNINNILRQLCTQLLYLELQTSYNNEFNEIK